MIAVVEPRPRASDTIMNYSSEFITEEAVSWLQSQGMRLKKGKVSEINFGLLQLYIHKLDRSIDHCSYLTLQRRMVAMAKISLPLPKMQTNQGTACLL